MASRVVVLGLGNLLLRDDGAGVVALHRLSRAVDSDPRVELIDGGTLGLALLDYIHADSVLIILDAVRAEGPPGRVVVLEGDDVAAAAAAKLSPHQVGVADLLCAADQLGRTPERTVLIGVIPESIELGLGRTPAVEAAIQEMVRVAIEEVLRAGVRLWPSHGGAGVEVSSALGV